MARASKEKSTKPSRKKPGKKTARVNSGAKRGFRFGLHDLMMEADPEYAKKREDWVRFLYLENRRMEPRTKELVIIGILAVLKSPPPHIKLHIDQAVKAGATREEILEAIQFAGHWGGTVAQHNALEAWRQHFAPESPEVHRALKP